jgi:hypothetical protein
MAVPGCGGRGDEQHVRDTVELFAKSSAARDYATLCQRVLAPTLVEKLRSLNLPCPVALRNFLGPVRQPNARVTAVRITGQNSAVAQVRTTGAGQPSASSEFILVRTPGGWRVAKPGGPAPLAPPTSTPTQPTPSD